jgi:hypothetical protein
MKKKRHAPRPARFSLPRVEEIPALFSEGAEPEPGRRPAAEGWPKTLKLRLPRLGERRQ